MWAIEANLFATGSIVPFVNILRGHMYNAGLR